MYSHRDKKAQARWLALHTGLWRNWQLEFILNQEIQTSYYPCFLIVGSCYRYSASCALPTPQVLVAPSYSAALLSRDIHYTTTYKPVSLTTPLNFSTCTTAYLILAAVMYVAMFRKRRLARLNLNLPNEGSPYFSTVLEIGYLDLGKNCC